MLELRYYRPRRDLAPYLGAYYICDSTDSDMQPIAAEMANVRFILRGEMETLWSANDSMPFRGAQIVGPTMRAYAMRSRGATRMFGAGVTPRGWAAMPLCDADGLVDRMEDLQLIASHVAGCALDRMQNATNDREIVAAADELFAAILDPNSRIARRFPAGVEKFLAGNALGDIDSLVDAAGLSRRQLDRVARAYFGASPKAILRKRRALFAAQMLAIDPKTKLADIGANLFYDQPHFTKEFRTFVGVTPARFVKGGAALMAESMRRRNAAA
jgi:AraC-like DNA-binding protein